MNKLILLFLFFMLILSSLDLMALPRFAVKLGDKCSDCHYNPSGGGIRSSDGWHWGKNTLSMISERDKDFIMSPRISDNISIGLDYRTQYIYSQSSKRTYFQNMTAALHTNFALSKQINLVGKYDFVNELWEGYGVARILPGNAYIKAGVYTPNFGIRLDDHTAYTREGLIFNPFYREVGVEIGFFEDTWLYASASIGSNLSDATSNYTKDPTYTVRAEITPRFGEVGLMFGGSYAAVKLGGSEGPLNTDMYGGFFGFGYDEFSLLAEYDLVKDLSIPNTKSNILMLEVAYGILTGLDAVVRYDRIDFNEAVNSDEISRMIFGFEFHPYSFIEVRPQYRLVFEDPSIDNDSFVLQLHFWY
ncbi:MAG: hypothetical protein ABI638_13180 [Ignavibacteriota bacterium]